MTETIPSLTQTAAWKALEAHSQENRNLTIKDLFAEDSTRGHRLTVEAAGIYFDYSKNRITDETLGSCLHWPKKQGFRPTLMPCFAGTKSMSRRSARFCTWL